jgi:hypothetical protein
MTRVNEVTSTSVVQNYQALVSDYILYCTQKMRRGHIVKSGKKKEHT